MSYFIIIAILSLVPVTLLFFYFVRHVQQKERHYYTARLKSLDAEKEMREDINKKIVTSLPFVNTAEEDMQLLKEELFPKASVEFIPLIHSKGKGYVMTISSTLHKKIASVLVINKCRITKLIMTEPVDMFELCSFISESFTELYNKNLSEVIEENGWVRADSSF